MDEFSEYWDYPIIYEEDAEFIETISLKDLYKHCLKTTLEDVLPQIFKLLFINFIFRCFIQTKVVANIFCHIFSTLCGVIIIYSVLKYSTFHIAVFIIFCFLVFKITSQLNQNPDWPYYLSVVCTIYLVLSEFYFPLTHSWLESRGLHMIIAMKVISIAFDMKKKIIKCPPTIVEYFGYMYCPSNCLFGPWISFNTYKAVFNTQFVFTMAWVRQIIYTLFITVVFLTTSNCWAYYLIPRNWKWFVAYQDAFSYRSSHYFISYLSETTMLMSGYSSLNSKKKKEYSWTSVVTKPLHIELPRSLVQVVVFWNIPIHLWLKTYVFQVCKPMGSFYAVIMTYVVSSFLHGFNIKLAAVLLSLGIYTYVEYQLRLKLSTIYRACIGANPCKDCDHLFKSHNLIVRLVNVAFSAIAIYHLAYLGCLLDNSSDEYENENGLDTFSKWSNLNYSSHLSVLFMYGVYKFI